MWKTYNVVSQPDTAHQTLAILNTPLKNNKGVTLWCLENNKEIKNHADLLQNWQKYFDLQQEIIVWPNNEEPSIQILQAIYQNKHAVILTTINNLETPIANWQALKDNKISLELGQKINLNQLPEDLTSLGLERSEQAWSDNTFSIKGSLVDIYQNEIISRFNIWENKIEQIETIDPLQMGKIKKVKQIDIWPTQIIHKESLANNLPNHCWLIYNHNYHEFLQSFSNQKIIFDPLAKKSDHTLITESLDNFQLNSEEKINFLNKPNPMGFLNLAKNLVLLLDKFP
ncbi:hypothetical protein HN670_01745 [bacterium]|jgi:transcription-repair coupling factor (superfamily II helicase)|nr:hypothetical protein [bacterium]MBT4649297.1 hypothetical protein [bacterium]MBT7553170.1 hypothetical protein [bacterium]